jgi:hypothetical protein
MMHVYIYIHTFILFCQYHDDLSIYTPVLSPQFGQIDSSRSSRGPQEKPPVTSPSRHLGDHRASGAIHHIQHQAQVTIHGELHLGPKDGHELCLEKTRKPLREIPVSSYRFSMFFM